MGKIIFHQSPLKKLVSGYVIFCLIFSLFYFMPISQTQHLTYIDALFLSSSALSGTGLSTFNLSENLSLLGQIIVIVEMQIGGIGIMVLIGSTLLLVHKKVSFPQLTLMGFDQNQTSIRVVKKMMLFVLIFSFIIEAIGCILVYPEIDRVTKDHGTALLHSIFHAVSSFTHSSLDLFGGNVYSFAYSPLFLLTTSFLIIFGGIGLPTIWELLFLRKKKKSLYTKVNILVHSSLLLIGTLLLLVVEWSNTLKPFHFRDKLINAFFLSAGSRNSGFSNIDVSHLTPSSLLLITILMFIGGSASSSAGGIRTSTFAVLVANAKRILQGKSEVVLFKKSLFEDDIQKAYLVSFLFLSVYLISLFGILTIEKGSLQQLSFEIMSAFTNTGFSTGITSDLSNASKLWLASLMMVGRIGILSIIYSVLTPTKSAIKYVKESIIVG